MDLVTLVVLLLIVGVVIHFFPIDGTIKNVLLCVIVIAILLSFTHGFGWYTGHRHWG